MLKLLNGGSFPSLHENVLYWLMPEPCMDEQGASLHQRMKAWKLIRCICVDMRGEAWKCPICVQIESFPT